MKKLLVIAMPLIALWANAQDTIIFKNNPKPVLCKIRNCTATNIFYIVQGEYLSDYMSNVKYHSKVAMQKENTNTLPTKWEYKDDSSKFAELICISHVSALSMLTGGDVNTLQKFEIYLNLYSDSTKNKGKLPFKYPLDALNFFSKKGWDLKYIYSVFEGKEKDIEVRHYLLERK